MKLKYYLRGLGLGMLITAAFFLSSGNSKNNTMTDAQVRARATELGMIDNPTLGKLSEETALEEASNEEISNEEVSTEELSNEEISSEEILSTEDISTQATQDEAVSEEESVSEEAAKEEETVVTPSTQEAVSNTNTEIVIVVNKGEGSDTVSRKLFEAGLVTDAKAYDRYLMQNGYDKKIAAGEHRIPASANEEEIAKILCSRK